MCFITFLQTHLKSRSPICNIAQKAPVQLFLRVSYIIRNSTANCSPVEKFPLSSVYCHIAQPYSHHIHKFINVIIINITESDCLLFHSHNLHFQIFSSTVIPVCRQMQYLFHCFSGSNKKRNHLNQRIKQPDYKVAYVQLVRGHTRTHTQSSFYYQSFLVSVLFE